MKKIYDVDIIVNDKNVYIEVFAGAAADTISGYWKITTYKDNIVLQEKSYPFLCKNKYGRDSAIASAFVSIDNMLTKKNDATKRIMEVVVDFYHYYNEEYPEDHIS